MSSWWGSDPFADLVAKATSELLPAGQEDIALNLEICDKVRAKQVAPKAAMQVIKKRISDANPNVVLLALATIEELPRKGTIGVCRSCRSNRSRDVLQPKTC